MPDPVLEAAQIDPRNADRNTICCWLTERVALYLQMPASEIDPGAPLAELGLDSVYALSLCGDIEDALDLFVEPTLAWDFPSIDAIAGHLAGRLAMIRPVDLTSNGK